MWNESYSTQRYQAAKSSFLEKFILKFKLKTNYTFTKQLII